MNEITSKTYDSHVLFHGPQAHIDVCYEPKAAPDRLRVEIVLRYLAPRPGERILDVGSGVGTFGFHSARSGASAVAVDYSIESMKMARHLSGRYTIAGRVDFVVGNALCLPFLAATFDKAAVIDFIEHITHEEKDALLKELRNVLKDGGFAVIFTPNAIRERIGELCWKLRHFFFGDEIPKNSLHYGLISRRRFEAFLKKHDFAFDFYYYDLTRPFLARIPFLKHFLSLNLLWVVHKK